MENMQSDEGEDESNELEVGSAVEANILEEEGASEKLEDKNDTKKKKIGMSRKDKPLLLWEVLQQEYGKWIVENLDKDVDLTNLNEISTEIIEPPDDVTIQLLRFQKEWLFWALKQEESDVRGGILADEMGMGKTLQAIALVLTKRNEICCVSEDLQAIKGTLVICPLTAVKQWQREIERFTLEGSTKVFTYHGAGREKRLGQLSEYDFVITTYSIVEIEYSASLLPQILPCHRESRNRSKTKSGNSVLHSVMWNRIILDEAHYIKGRSSKRTTAVLALKSSYKWALSGTPIQNRVGEFYSLVRFLQIVPYSYYFCKECDCRTLNYRPSQKCPDCGHTFFRHFSWWNKYVISQILDGSQRIWGRKEAMILLKHKILKSIMLRRTKKGREADLALPPKIEIVRQDSLDEVEKDYYELLCEETRKKFNRYVQRGPPYFQSNQLSDLLSNLLGRKRQAVNHPYLVEYSDFQMEMKAKTCTPCDQSHEDTANSRTPIEGFRPSSILNRIQLDNFQSSTKTEALREEITFMVERDATAKGLVFSGFLSFLDLIQYVLQKSEVKCARLDGSMTIAAREAAITRFTEDPDCRILLMTMKAGGVALNLTVASHVFLMDPGWNPAVERQAQDRVHRIGQHKPTRIVRFIIKDTVEDRLLKLQEKKNLVFEGTVGEGTANALTKLTKDELYFLFQ